jgi:prepilin-type N-terminal cleavage/methylation domain-containing protein
MTPFSLPSSLPNRERQPGGFTLVELAVVGVIMSVLAAFAVPRFLTSVERSKAAEAFNYLATVHSAQERYHARHGQYADELSKLGAKLPTPAYFSVGSLAVPLRSSTFEKGWELPLFRSTAAPGRRAYTVIFNQDGFDRANSTIPDEFNPFHSL